MVIFFWVMLALALITGVYVIVTLEMDRDKALKGLYKREE